MFILAGATRCDSAPSPDLVEVALVHGLGDVADLAALVGLSLLLVELLGQRLQLGQGHLQGQTVGVAHWCVLQHVLVGESHVGLRSVKRQRLMRTDANGSAEYLTRSKTKSTHWKDK